ncbi:MAG TPA: glycine cleavage system aminomethyltransferase GcvT [Bacteroidales bacterium]|nr:glycine cleavage system aminomethyltransferase GcvT [Bacteroidales bacterium]HRT46946.1 glycine cleavage system aminomethyltransferase GcvT [Bacteroidales bacterium]HRU56541.1 glycine cleavage system aminomethyltransferase GcvT [Bacteroidales bacterium]
MKHTPFTQIHIGLGAKMVPFAGFYMPVEYTGIIDEHITVREKVGVFDVSHMGEFRVKGPNAFAFLQYITSNDVSALYDGKVQYSCFPNGRGGIVDDLLIYRFSSDDYLLVVNAANIEKDWQWCVQHARRFGILPGKEIINLSDSTAQLAVQGPLALKAMQKLTSASIEDMEYYTFKVIEFAGIKDVIFSTTGYTGAGGCEIYVKNEDGPRLWEAVFEAGKEFGIKPAGLGARDTLRLEMGYCLYGNDIDDTTSPIEAGLGWITKFVDGKDFIDRELLLKQKTEGTSRKLRGFEMIEKGIPRQHYEVFDSAGNKIGEVTSGTMSPMLKKGIGMAYLTRGFWKPGTEIFIRIRNKDLKAVIVELPFYKKQ